MLNRFLQISYRFLYNWCVCCSCRDVYLDGNSLESEGAMDLVQALADRAELEHFEREELTKRSMDDEAVTAVSSLKGEITGHIN